MSAAPRAARADTLGLAWESCRESGGLPSVVFGCGVNTATFTLVPSFTLDQPVDSVYAMELVIDLVSAINPLPAWWRLDPGQCRDGQLSADLAPAGCADPWNGFGAAAVQDYQVGTPGGSTAHARILVAVVTPTDSLRALAASEPYQPCRLVLSTRQTTTCAGCLGDVCLVLNSILIRRLVSTPNDTVLLQSSPATSANWAQWQGSGADCATVPVRRVTWGTIKALYR